MRETRYPMIVHHSVLDTSTLSRRVGEPFMIVYQQPMDWYMDDYGYMSPVFSLPRYMREFGVEMVVPPILDVWVDKGIVEDVSCKNDMTPRFEFLKLRDYLGEDNPCAVFLRVNVPDNPPYKIYTLEYCVYDTITTKKCKILIDTNVWSEVIDKLHELECQRDGYTPIYVTISLTTEVQLNVDASLSPKDILQDIHNMIAFDGMELLMDEEVEITKIERGGEDITQEILDADDKGGGE